jgi:hypothetical protein
VTLATEIALTVAAVAIVAVVVRGLARRLRLLRQIERAEAAVAGAVADGRLSTATGEAALQHLEGLRRACGWRGEG